MNTMGGFVDAYPVPPDTTLTLVTTPAVTPAVAVAVEPTPVGEEIVTETDVTPSYPSPPSTSENDVIIPLVEMIADAEAPTLVS